MSEPVASGPQSSRLYVVTGAGPVGWTVAEQLAAAGHRVRILTRSGSGPAHPLVEKLSIDVSDPPGSARPSTAPPPSSTASTARGTTPRCGPGNCPAAEQNVLAAAGGAGAVVVFPESLYSYSAPEQVMTEESPRRGAGRQARHPDCAAEGPRGIRNGHRERGGERFLWPPGPRGARRRAHGEAGSGGQIHDGDRTGGPAAFLYLRSGPRGRHDRGRGQAAAVEQGVACTHRACR